jgi:hypothetical protein
MADLNMNDRLTALEISRRFGSKDAMIIHECLSQTNELLIDTPHIACNHGEWHEHLLRDTYPRAQLRAYNQGVGEVSTQTRVIREGLAEMAIYSCCDSRLAKASGHEKELYMQNATGIIMGMGVQMADYLIYGSKNTDVRCIDGLDVRYRDITNERNVFVFSRAGGEGTNVNERCTSVYICALGVNNMHLLHNASASGTAGVLREDHGYQDRQMETGGHMPAHVEYFIAQFGLAIEHPDSVKRICNIPTDGSLTRDDRAKLIDMILHAQKLLPAGAGTTAIYGNIFVEEIVEKAARELEIVVSPEKDPWGHPVNLINGMRVRRMDVIKDSAELPAEFVS